MRKHYLKIAMIVLVFFAAGTFLSEAAFVYLDAAGRSDALGGSGVAGLGSNMKNPANIHRGEKFSLSFSHTDLYNLDLPTEIIELKAEAFKLPMALTINRLTDGAGLYSERAYTLTVGKRFQRFATGINIKRLSLEAEANGQGWAFDLGSNYDFNHNTTVGIAVRDLFSAITYDTGREEIAKTDLLLGFVHQRADFLYTAEIGNNNGLKLGLEKSFSPNLMMRVGYTQQQVTAGLGLKKGNLTFDYAYVPHALGNAHRLYLKLGL